MADFTLAIKSTIDKAGTDLAASLGVAKFVDLDDPVNMAEAMASTDDVIVWRFVTLDEDPIDPLYSIIFAIGAKTSIDPSSYDLLSFVSKTKKTFAVSEGMDIYDWSGAAVPTEKLGVISFIESGVDTQMFDKESGVRMVTVAGRVQRFI